MPHSLCPTFATVSWCTLVNGPTGMVHKKRKGSSTWIRSQLRTPPENMPNSAGCVHSWPQNIYTVWQILISLGVQVLCCCCIWFLHLSWSSCRFARIPSAACHTPTCPRVWSPSSKLTDDELIADTNIFTLLHCILSIELLVLLLIIGQLLLHNNYNNRQ